MNTKIKDNEISTGVQPPALQQSPRFAPITFAEKLSRLVIPEECQRDQGDSNDPQNDIFTAVLFFGHKVQYSIPQVSVQVSR